MSKTCQKMSRSMAKTNVKHMCRKVTQIQIEINVLNKIKTNISKQRKHVKKDMSERHFKKRLDKKTCWKSFNKIKTDMSPPVIPHTACGVPPLFCSLFLVCVVFFLLCCCFYVFFRCVCVCFYCCCSVCCHLLLVFMCFICAFSVCFFLLCWLCFVCDVFYVFVVVVGCCCCLSVCFHLLLFFIWFIRVLFSFSSCYFCWLCFVFGCFSFIYCCCGCCCCLSLFFIRKGAFGAEGPVSLKTYKKTN